jgi:ADP-ribose pyrophosphatase YjhB (NUDIX family)
VSAGEGDLRFCPLCAGALERRDAGQPASRQPVCTACGYVLWRNLKATVEAMIVRGEGAATEVLLGRRAGSEPEGWDIPGGFLNADDRLHAALRRECLREYGVHVEIGDLLGAFEDEYLGARIVSLIYMCRVTSGEPRAADIVDRVAWFPLDATPPIAYAAVRDALAALRARIAPG